MHGHWLVGTFEGRGVNHEGQPFVGRLVGRAMAGLQDSALELSFSARAVSQAHGEEGELFHTDRSWIAPTMDGTLGLWTLSNNLPGVLEHAVESDEEQLVATAGDLGSEQGLRHQLLLARTDLGVSLQFSWGLPGQPFGPRSAVAMIKQ